MQGEMAVGTDGLYWRQDGWVGLGCLCDGGGGFVFVHWIDLPDRVAIWLTD